MSFFNQLTAERAGFEPAKPFWSLRTFQARAFDHSATSPLKLPPKLEIIFHKIYISVSSPRIFFSRK